MDEEGKNEGVGNIIQKSPQELASQVVSVFSTGFEYSRIKDGVKLDEKYKQMKKKLENVMQIGVSDQQLSDFMDGIYKDGVRLGIYLPTKGEGSEKFIEAATSCYLDWGYSQEKARTEAANSLDNSGYVAELRRWRRGYEEEINGQFSGFVEKKPLSEEEERGRIVELEKRCIDTRDGETEEILSKDFSGGNFLYHGTEVEQAIEILDSGDLINTKLLYDREDERHKKEGGEKRILKKNSGFEGISWNFNEIGAMPGDRYHLVGFLASPHEVLDGNKQLAVPSRPAPNELILLDGSIDSKLYYEIKTQQELVFSFSMGESNSVWSNIAQLSSVREQAATKKAGFFDNSMLEDFCKKNVDNDTVRGLLRSRYSIRDNGTVLFSPDLLQQPNNEIPVGAVWLQALIDTGRIKNVAGFENVEMVAEAVERIDQDNYENFLPEVKKEKKYLEGLVDAEDDKVTGFGVAVEKMYMVVSDNDLKKWLKVLARCKSWPKGIIIYDHNKVRLENFASVHRGDNSNLEGILRKLIPESDGFVNYDEEILGEEITADKMVGYRKHVVGEQYLTNRKTMRKDENGNLVIE